MSKEQFYTNEMTIAGYLMAEHDIEMIEAYKDDNDRFHIELDIAPEKASKLLNGFPTSKICKFDRIIKFLKGILCPKTKTKSYRSK